jgi:hypothetical protein
VGFGVWGVIGVGGCLLYFFNILSGREDITNIADYTIDIF